MAHVRLLFGAADRSEKRPQARTAPNFVTHPCKTLKFQTSSPPSEIAIASEASEALADLDEFWKVTIEKSGMSVWETRAYPYVHLETGGRPKACRSELARVRWQTSAANLKFLSVSLQDRYRNFKFKAALENNRLLELL
jgi:hypothetical protein